MDLPGAGVADERDGRPGGHVEVDPVQHLDTLPVAEAHVFETNVALDPGQGLDARPVDDDGLLVHDVHDLVERRHRRQERVVELRELLDRVEEVREVEEKSEERAHAHLAARRQPPSVAEDDRRRDGGEEVDEGEVEAVQDDRFVVRRPVVRVDAAEVPLVRALARERLHDAHARDVLGQGRRDETEPLAHSAVGT